MRTFLCLAVALACACSSKKADDKAAPPAGDPLAAHATAFFMKLADATDAGDCEKLTAALEAMAPDAKALKAELEAAHKKLNDVPPDPKVAERMQKLKDPGIIDRCEKDAAVKDRLSKALDNSLLQVVPLMDDDSAKAMGDAFGKAFAPTPK